jgi:hypothetical protein
LMSFGWGEADYNRQFSDECLEDNSVLLLRKTLANRLRCGSHMAFCYLYGVQEMP